MERKSKNLFKSSIIYTIASVMVKGINLITFPIFSRYLIPAEYGVVNLYTVLTSFIVLIASLQLNSCIATTKSKFNNEKNESIVISIASFVSLIFIILIIISFVFRKSMGEVFRLDSNLIVFATIQSFFIFIINFYNTILVHEKKDISYLLNSVIITFLNITISLILVIYMKNNKYLGMIIGNIISTLLIGSILYFKLTNKKFFIKKDDLYFALKISLPIVPHVLGHQLLSSSDRIMLNNIFGSDSVGIYAFAYNIGMLIKILWNSINNAWVPWLFKNLKDEKYNTINIITKQYIYLFMILTIVFIFLTPEITFIMASKEYWSAITIIPLIAISYYIVFLYSFPVNYQFYFEKTKYIPLGTGAAAIINILLNLYFIPKYAAVAATMTTLISYTLLFLFHLLIVKYIVKFNDKNIMDYFKSIIIIIMATAIFYFIIDIGILRYIVIFVLIMYCIVNKKQYMMFLKAK